MCSLMWCLLIFISSYSVSGWSFRGGPGLFPFLCLSVHTFQNSRGSAGNTLLSSLVNIHSYYIFRHIWIGKAKCLLYYCQSMQNNDATSLKVRKKEMLPLAVHVSVLVCRIIITIWNTFTCPRGEVGWH